MRIIGRFVDEKQASMLIDTLKKAGFDRKDMIVSDLSKQAYENAEEALEKITFVKSETDGLGEYETFTSGIDGLSNKAGIVVAVETPKKESNRIRSYMEQSGAVEIIQD